MRSHNSLVRWQQIDRFFHISPSEPTDTTPPMDDPNVNCVVPPISSKLNPLNIHLREKFKQYWTTGTHLAVDETIVRFLGRATKTLKLPSKPTPEGFKIWCLANGGYVLDWPFHAKGPIEPNDIDDLWTKKFGFSNTQAVVLDLVSQEGISKQFKRIVWLDNLFKSARLLTTLRKERFGAAGTSERKRLNEKLLNRRMEQGLKRRSFLRNQIVT